MAPDLLRADLAVDVAGPATLDRTQRAGQLVMKDGRVVESGLTDQVLDDPQHAYTQLLTSAVLNV